MSMLKNWHWTRWLRAAIAGAFIAQGLASGDTMAYAIGAFFGIQAIFNVGCFGAGTCAPAASTNNDKNKDITYQEIR
jgi:hypothetical protein